MGGRLKTIPRRTGPVRGSALQQPCAEASTWSSSALQIRLTSLLEIRRPSLSTSWSTRLSDATDPRSETSVGISAREDQETQRSRVWGGPSGCAAATSPASSQVGGRRARVGRRDQRRGPGGRVSGASTYRSSIRTSSAPAAQARPGAGTEGVNFHAAAPLRVISRETPAADSSTFIRQGRSPGTERRTPCGAGAVPARRAPRTTAVALAAHLGHGTAGILRAEHTSSSSPTSSSVARKAVEQLQPAEHVVE